MGIKMSREEFHKMCDKARKEIKKKKKKEQMMIEQYHADRHLKQSRRNK